MIRPRFLALFCAGGLTLLATGGCSHDQPSSKDAAATGDRRQGSDPQEQPPYAGMTKDEVVRRYGNPRSVVVTEMGERWVYWLNEGEVLGKALIPFYVPPRPRYGTLFFDADGRVREFHWDQVNDR